MTMCKVQLLQSPFTNLVRKWFVSVVLACFPVISRKNISINSLLTIQDAKHQDKKTKETSWFIQKAFVFLHCFMHRFMKVLRRLHPPGCDIVNTFSSLNLGSLNIESCPAQRKYAIQPD